MVRTARLVMATSVGTGPCRSAWMKNRGLDPHVMDGDLHEVRRAPSRPQLAGAVLW